MADSSAVLWRGPVYNFSGYAEEGRQFLSAMVRAGMRVRLEPIDSLPNFKRFLSSEERLMFLDMEAEARPPEAAVIHASAPVFADTGLPLQIGRTMFETDGLHPEWVEKCNRMDQIWVPSAFNLETFTNAGVKPEKIRVVPEGIDPNHYAVPPEPLRLPGQRGFAFLSIFDVSPRKGWDILLKAFRQAFRPDEDVSLVLKITNVVTQGRGTSAIATYLVNELRADSESMQQIIVTDAFLPAKELARLYLGADAFVVPSRGEGWGRPHMEAMAWGLPTIGTRWSGNLSFMNDENSYLVEIKGLVPVPPAFPNIYYRGQRWAEPDPDSLVHLLRYVFDHREEARAKGAKARRDILAHWTNDQAVAIMQKELREGRGK